MKDLVKKFYRKVFGEKMTVNIKNFFKNLSYLAIGFIVAKILTGIFNILCGRIIGPAEYGKLTLIISIASFLMIPMFMGIPTGMVKYNAEREDFKRRQEVISTSYILIFSFSLISMVIYFLFKSRISKIFSVKEDIFYLAIIFSIIYAGADLIKSTIQSLHLMKKRATLEVIFGITLLGTFLSLFWFKNSLSFKSAVFSICLAYFIVAIFGINRVIKYTSFKFNRQWAKILICY